MKRSGMIGTGSLAHNRREFIAENVDPDRVQLNICYGKYGMLRKQLLKEHRLARYQYLLLTGKLNEHLNQTDQEAREQVEMLMEQMAQKEGVAEELKLRNQLKLVQKRLY